MKINLLAIYTLLLIISGCGGSASSSAPSEPVGTIYVDSVNGNDIGGDGSNNLPFRTLTHSINMGRTTQIILAPGTYDSTNGEVFPVIVPAGVTIRSNTIDYANNQFALVQGSGPYTSQALAVTKQVTFLLSEGSTIQSIVVMNPSGVGVWNESEGIRTALVEKCVIRNCKTGVISAGGSSLKIERSSILDNVDIGLDTLNKAHPSLMQTKIIGNGIGILVSDNALPSFNPEHGGESNELRGNSFCDLRNLGFEAIEAQGVLWDDDPFLFSVSNSCSGGANIVNEGSGAVLFQYMPPIGVPVFVGTRRLKLNSPIRGAVISTDQPEFSWTTGVSTRTFVAVWDRPPSFTSGKLGDKSAIKWLWHSGLGTGVTGSVTFKDGRSMFMGDLNNLALAQPLQRGKSFYWAVWDWDESALFIQASSELGYFTVLN